MERNIIYHIGLPKTGTTFLQKKYFPNLRGDVICAQRKYPYPAGDLREWLHYVREVTSNVTPASEKYLDAKNIIYSDEDIAITWLLNYIYWPHMTLEKVADRMLAFHKLKFGRTHIPHILIGFRDFKNWIISLYAEMPDFDDFDDMLDVVEGNPERYNRYVIEKCFRDRFDSVFIYGQEEISKDLYSLNNWFKKFGLDGEHIVISRHNIRQSKSPNIVYKRIYPRRKILRRVYSFCLRLLFLDKLRWRAATIFLKLTEIKISISSSQLERIRLIEEKLRSPYH